MGGCRKIVKMKPLLPLLAALAGASAAHAGAQDPLRAAVFQPKAPAQTPLPRGVARTAIETRFDDRAQGAVGYLCGRKPDEVLGGAAGARGIDHDGRFLGLQLKLSLR